MKFITAGMLFFTPVLSSGQGGLTKNVARDPAKAQFVYKDVENFIRAFEMLTPGCDTLAVLRTEYIDKGTPGLKIFIEKYGLTPEMLIKKIRKFPEKYGSLGDLPGLLDEQIKIYRREYTKLKRLIPDAVFPPTYFLVEAHRGIGSGSIEGPLISVDKWIRPIEEGKKSHLVHEMIHLQQVAAQGYDQYIRIFGPEKNLLALCIREGTAEYFAFLVTGIVGKDEALAFLEKSEKRLWEQFRKEMYGEETGEWMWRKTSNPEQPRDVGYAMGYLIVEAYYENAKDKKSAVREILSVTDYPAFLEKSGYAAKFAK